MKLLGFIYMAGGCSLAILVLRAINGIWAEFWEIAMYSAIPNGLTALIAFLLFRRPNPPDATMDRLFLVACYVIGIGGGVYFYYT